MGLIKKIYDKMFTHGLTLSEQAVYKFIKEIDSGIYDGMFWGEEVGAAYELQFFNDDHLLNEIVVSETSNPYENSYEISSKIILDSLVHDYLKRRLYKSVEESERRDLVRKEKEFEAQKANELKQYLYEDNK